MVLDTALDKLPPYVKGKPSKESAAARDAFFAYKKKHPAPPEKLTGIQRRMQSGGA